MTDWQARFRSVRSPLERGGCHGGTRQTVSGARGTRTRQVMSAAGCGQPALPAPQGWGGISLSRRSGRSNADRVGWGQPSLPSPPR